MRKGEQSIKKKMVIFELCKYKHNQIRKLNFKENNRFCLENKLKLVLNQRKLV